MPRLRSRKMFFQFGTGDRKSGFLDGDYRYSLTRHKTGSRLMVVTDRFSGSKDEFVNVNLRVYDRKSISGFRRFFEGLRKYENAWTVDLRREYSYLRKRFNW